MEKKKKKKNEKQIIKSNSFSQNKRIRNKVNKFKFGYCLVFSREKKERDKGIRHKGRKEKKITHTQKERKSYRDTFIH